MIKSVHIVSFDVPYPANYGGVIDVYHRVKTLHELGVDVILHCFEYGRGRQAELEKITSKVIYYSRTKNPFLLLKKDPFIISSRKNSELIQNLTAIEAPIIFEGHHTCTFLDHPNLVGRTKLVRAHNIEHEYYSGLAQAEKSFFKRLFFKIEAKKLERFEAKLKLAKRILTVSLKEQEYFQNNFQNALYLPVFNALSIGEFEPNKENYTLFHGNLSVPENDLACHYLIDTVFSNSNLNFKIAGFEPKKELLEKIKIHKNIDIISSPNDAELNNLIRKAQINILYTFQNTGIKHKLLNSLSNGGFCIVNNDMVSGTGLESLCIEVNSPKETKEEINRCLEDKYSKENYDSRIKFLNDHFNMKKNGRILIEELSQ